MVVVMAVVMAVAVAMAVAVVLVVAMVMAVGSVPVVCMAVMPQISRTHVNVVVVAAGPFRLLVLLRARRRGTLLTPMLQVGLVGTRLLVPLMRAAWVHKHQSVWTVRHKVPHDSDQPAS